MATAVTPGKRLMTAEEFFDFCHRPENRDRFFELERGEVVEMSRPGERHCAVCGNATGLFWWFARQRGRGYVCPNDMGLVVERDPDTVRGADVAFYDESRKYEDLDPKYPEHLPKLIVDVFSPNDRWGKMMRRVGLFLARGVPLVWVIDPEDRTITVIRSGREPVLFTADQEITGEDILPDLRLKVADFFAMVGA
jgi:Uma2 family endonuclease